MHFSLEKKNNKSSHMQQMDCTKTWYHLPCVKRIISFDVRVEWTRISQ